LVLRRATGKVQVPNKSFTRTKEKQLVGRQEIIDWKKKEGEKVKIQGVFPVETVVGTSRRKSSKRGCPSESLTMEKKTENSRRGPALHSSQREKLFSGS